MIFRKTPQECEVGDAVMIVDLLKNGEAVDSYSGDKIRFDSAPGFEFEVREYPSDGGKDFGWVRVL